MRARELKELVRASLRAGSARGSELGTIYIEGPPGIGKSEIIQEVADEEDAGCVDFRLLLRDPTDLRGIPVPDFENSIARWMPPSELPSEKSGHAEQGILFFDDLPTAPPLVQASAYQIAITPHCIGEYQLPEGWIIVGAGNRSGDRALVHRMPSPLANRMLHTKLDLNLQDWTLWASGAKVNPVIIGFLNSPAADQSGGDHLLFVFNPEREEKAFPTPRSWHMVSRLMSAGLHPEIEAEAIEGTVGAGASAQFSAFRRLFQRLPDPKEILVNANFKVTPKEMDLKYALVAAVAQTAEGKTQYNNAIKWADVIEPEFAVLTIQMLAGRDKQQVLKAPDFPKWAQKNKDVVISER